MSRFVDRQAAVEVQPNVLLYWVSVLVSPEYLEFRAALMRALATRPRSPTSPERSTATWSLSAKYLGEFAQHQIRTTVVSAAAIIPQ
jgi:hypothetical protein